MVGMTEIQRKAVERPLTRKEKQGTGVELEERKAAEYHTCVANNTYIIDRIDCIAPYRRDGSTGQKGGMSGRRKASSGYTLPKRSSIVKTV